MAGGYKIPKMISFAYQPPDVRKKRKKVKINNKNTIPEGQEQTEQNPTLNKVLALGIGIKKKKENKN